MTVRLYGSTVGKVGSAPPGPGGGDYPAWRFGKPPNVWFKIPATASMVGATNVISNTIDDWNGLAANSAGKLYSILAGGHSLQGWRTAAVQIDLTVDAPAWATLYSGVTIDPAGYYRTASPAPNSSPAIVDSAYYLSNGQNGAGNPVSRHTYVSTFYLSASQSPDGIPRVFALTDSVGYGFGLPDPHFEVGPQVDSFRLDNNTYSPAGTYTSHPAQTRYADWAQDSRTGYVYSVGDGGDGALDSWYYKWVAGSWVKVSITPRYPDAGRILNGAQQGSLVDASRNRLVLMHDGRPYDTSRGARMYCVDLTSQVTTIIWITGDLPASWGNDQSVIHDTGNDRYIFFNARTPYTDVYSIVPSGANAGVSTLTATIASCPINSAIVRRCAYFAALGGIAYVPRYDDNVWFLPTV